MTLTPLRLVFASALALTAAVGGAGNIAGPSTASLEKPLCPLAPQPCSQALADAEAALLSARLKGQDSQDLRAAEERVRAAAQACRIDQQYADAQKLTRQASVLAAARAALGDRTVVATTSRLSCRRPYAGGEDQTAGALFVTFADTARLAGSPHARATCPAVMANLPVDGAAAEQLSTQTQLQACAWLTQAGRARTGEAARALADAQRADAQFAMAGGLNALNAARQSCPARVHHEIDHMRRTLGGALEALQAPKSPHGDTADYASLSTELGSLTSLDQNGRFPGLASAHAQALSFGRHVAACEAGSAPVLRQAPPAALDIHLRTTNTQLPQVAVATVGERPHSLRD